MTSAAALEIAGIPLNGAQFFLRNHAGELKVLVCSHDMVVPVFDQFHQVIVRFPCFAFIFHI